MKSNSDIFRNNSKTFLSKSKHASAAVLPPCRICGARASGLHYGVNSCEACKGFFRRALKRPMVFSCSKSKRCDVKGNKRSTCRFCRYKKCLSLGMARESIKTGRYSYKKRTRDTLEVKRLQRLPHLTTSEPELDNITKNLVIAHDCLITSTVDAPSDLIYQKQLEYHNIYLLYQKFGNHPELITKTSADLSRVHENPSRPSDNTDYQMYVNKPAQLSSPSRSVSQLSSDSGFVDETVANGYTAALSNNCNKHEDFPNCAHDSSDHAKEQGTESFCVSDTNQYGMPAVKTLEQHSADEKMFTLSGHKEGCSLDTDYLPSRDPATKSFSEDSQRVCSVSCCENNNKTNCSSSCHVQDNSDNADSETTQYCKHSDVDLSKNMFRNIHTAPSMKSCSRFVNCKKCSRQTNTSSQDVFSRKRENMLQTHDFESSSDDAIFSSAATIKNCSSQCERSRFGGLYRSSDDTQSEADRDITLGHTAATEPGVCTNFRADVSKVCATEEDGCSLSMRGESHSEIIHRAKTWIQGYIDFAKEIPGFSSLSCQDQASLLKHAWDEVWMLGVYRGYNSALGVAMTPRGICFHGDEMAKAWGSHHSRFAFIMADIIKRYNLSRQLIILLKAVCIVAPDRCPLVDSEKVAELHWMMVSCLQRHAEKTHYGNCKMFPRLISVLTSLRELSESAKREIGTRDLNFSCDYNILSQTLMPF